LLKIVQTPGLLPGVCCSVNHEARRFEDFQAEAVFALWPRELPLLLLADAFATNSAARFEA
jgi:hypothetical protein